MPCVTHCHTPISTILPLPTNHTMTDLHNARCIARRYAPNIATYHAMYHSLQCTTLCCASVTPIAVHSYTIFSVMHHSLLSITHYYELVSLLFLMSPNKVLILYSAAPHDASCKISASPISAMEGAPTLPLMAVASLHSSAAASIVDSLTFSLSLKELRNNVPSGSYRFSVTIVHPTPCGPLAVLTA